jgi:hypothetical protein
MTGLSMELEIAVLDAVRVVYKRKGTPEAVISRTDVVNEILEHPKKYGIRVFNIIDLRKMVTSVCCEHFEEISNNWRNGAWIVRGVAE